MTAMRGRGRSAGGFDGLDLEHHAVVEADRGERLAPDAAGVEADVVRADVEAEGGPVAEDDGVGGPGRVLEGEPGDAAGGRVGGAAVEVGLDAAVGAQGAAANEIREDGAPAIAAAEVVVPARRRAAE